ncbi:hybrid sensor histidine kinase/response regulator [Cellulophaga sp. Hel_I_12]|uniref:hybrid sensor histidine kinase/response regulator n=1 Tax=Cellulophaga sp. Hel_I_12 TaxID=1249972 RepID=UPI00068DCE2C|nr:hybrid sensor histidine kinase/response regulator [Cellulophaga sp. Hel_I_12]
MKHLLFFTYLIGIGLYAQNDVFDPLKSKGQLFEYATFYNSGSADLSLQEVAKDSLFIGNILESENHSVGFTTDNFWVRFRLENSSENSMTYYLETARPITDKAELYLIDGNEIQTFKSGDKIPFNNRQVAHRATIFKLDLPANSIQQIYLHFNSDGETLNIPLNLYSEPLFWYTNYNQQLFLGLFYGLLFLAGVIYLFFYTSLKESAFLYYGLYVFSIAFMQAALDGFIFEFLLPSGGFLNSRAVLITALFSNFFLLKYCEHFLKIGIQLKNFKTAFYVIYTILALLFLLLFINDRTLEIAYPLSNLNGLFSLILILITLITMRFKGIDIDTYFFIGIFFLVLGLLGFVMNNLSLLPNNFYTLNSAKFGSGFEVIFLSLSMTNLIGNLRLEKEISQAEALHKSQEISQLKTFFMSNMSHELRTPINAIMGIAEHQLGNLNNKETREQFEIIKNASLSLLSNVNDIIDFEQIEKNKLELNLQNFSPSSILNQLSNNWKAEATKKGLGFNFHMNSEIPTKVNGDPERFIQIVNNVLANAVKFTKKGSVSFDVTTCQQPGDICLFSFVISDTGVGIDPENIKTIFESFSQMRSNHSREYGGIGLGLTIVKHLVELFNGTISIDSKINKGTAICIELPLKNSIKENEYVTELKTNLDALIPQHVLIVEDNKLNQMVMRKILKSFPHVSFKVVNNGQEALDALVEDIYDLILMDLQMPIMDGYEATRIIRSGVLGKLVACIPIIAVTADALQETRQKVSDLGMNDYMTKPVDKDLLLEKIISLSINKGSKHSA